MREPRYVGPFLRECQVIALTIQDEIVWLDAWILESMFILTGSVRARFKGVYLFGIFIEPEHPFMMNPQDDIRWMGDIVEDIILKYFKKEKRT